MAMFLGGLEETPYSGWTLTNLVNVREKLYLTCPYFNCDTLTGTTTVSGSAPAVDFGRWLFTATGEQQLPASMDVASGADCDLRAEYDIANLIATGKAVELKVNYSGTFVSAKLSATQLALSVNGVDTTAAFPADRFGTLRLVKAGSSWSAYYWNVRTRVWSTALTGTQAVTGAGTVRLAATLTTGTLKTHAWGVRNVYPSATSGTAESPVLDTEDGLRSVGWFTVPGTGSVAVEYRAGATPAECSAAAYASATGWGIITPSPSNRFVQVRVSVTGGSTTAPSPEAGPVMVYSSVDAATAQLLFKRHVSMLVRHTDVNYRLTVNENASGVSPFTCFWNRALEGVGRYIDYSGTVSLTFEGTTVDLGTYAIEGGDRMVTDETGTTNLLVEAANWLLPGVYRGGPLLYNHSALTTTRKSTWTTAIQAQLAAAASVNWYTFQLTVKAYFNALKIVDPASWATYNTDADYSTPWNSMEPYHGGDGAWDDYQVATTSHFDVYTRTMGGQLGSWRQVYGTFSNDAVVSYRAGANAANVRQLCDYFGSAISHGRSVHAAGWLQSGHNQHMTADGLRGPAGWGWAREMYSRGLWAVLRYAAFPGFDIVPLAQDRKGDPDSADTSYTNYSVTNTMVTSFLGAIGYSEVATAPIPAPRPAVASAHAWPGMGVVQCWGANDADPVLYFNAKDYDTTAGPGGRHGYQTGVNSTLFARNYGSTTTIPRQHGLLGWRDSALSSTNYVLLSKTPSPRCVHCGRASVVWRSGVAQQWSPTVAGTDTVTTVTEAHVLYGHHVQALTKVALGARTLTSVGYIGLGMPAAVGESAANVDLAGHAYGESAEGLSVYLRILAGLDSYRVGSDFYSGDAFFDNRRNDKSLPPDVFLAAASLTGTQYFAVDQAYRHAPMTPATEDGWVGSWTRSTDLVTYEADAAGTPALVLVGLAAQTNPATGSYALTGSVLAFVASKNAPDWGGGSDVTLITYSAQNVVGLSLAGNVSWEKVSGRKTRLRWDGAGNLTVYSLVLPAGFNRVYAMDWDGTPVDVSRYCTFSGASVVVPAGLLAPYDFGLVTVDVVSEGGMSVGRPGVARNTYRPRPFCPGLAR